MNRNDIIAVAVAAVAAVTAVFRCHHRVIGRGMNALRQEVLEEIPRQLLEYMHAAGITPNAGASHAGAAGASSADAGFHLPAPRPKVNWSEE